jgi:hypothetical protein
MNKYFVLKKIIIFLRFGFSKNNFLSDFWFQKKVNENFINFKNKRIDGECDRIYKTHVFLNSKFDFK